jgi:hypothetical protein
VTIKAQLNPDGSYSLVGNALHGATLVFATVNASEVAAARVAQGLEPLPETSGGTSAEAEADSASAA